MKKLFYPIFFSCIIVVSACKKNNPDNKPNSNDTKLQLTLDSIYMIAQEDYYWHSFLTEYSIFNPRQYTSQTTDLLNFSQEIDAYTQLSKNPQNVDPKTGKQRPYEYDPYDPGTSKYSFIDDGDINKELNATKGDFGFSFFYKNIANDIRVSLVYPGSPADKAGLTRGDQIISINGSTGIYVTNINDLDHDVGYQYTTNALQKGSVVTLQLKKQDGTTVTKSINAITYDLNPVIYVNTYPIAGTSKVAGYMVFNNFTSLAVAQPKLDAIFADFATKGVTDLIIDLRYNGGGDVLTSNYLSNLIAPTSASGTVMNTTYWTDNMQNDKYPILRKKLYKEDGHYKPANQVERFQKAGPVNVNRVFFLVTGNTASASELTINNLRPKMDVQMIGQTTYGKPVGFISNLIINGHYFYTPEFEIKNSNNEGGYYLGMKPTGATPNGGTYIGKLDDDDLTHDFGDLKEGLLNDALTYIRTNSYVTSNTLKVQSLQSSALQTMTSEQLNTLAVKTNKRSLHAMYIDVRKK